MNESIEIWKEIPKYDNYLISNLGNLKSLYFNKSKILKPYKNVYGYYQVGLFRDGKQKKFKIHQLVAMAFLNYKINDHKGVINHKNFDKSDNSIKNIEIISQRNNTNKKHINHSSKYTGVSKFNNKWTATIFIEGKQVYLGIFESEIEASIYYEKALYNYNNGLSIEVKKPKFTSKFKGVRFDKSRNKWIAEILINGKSKYLGRFSSEKRAAEEYNKVKILIQK